MTSYSILDMNRFERQTYFSGDTEVKVTDFVISIIRYRLRAMMGISKIWTAIHVSEGVATVNCGEVIRNFGKLLV